MSQNSTVRLFHQLALSGAVVLSTVGTVEAQLSGGDFGSSSTAKQSSSIPVSRATVDGAQKSHGEFNALPFRTTRDAADGDSLKPTTGRTVRPPIRLTSPNPKTQTPDLPSPNVARGAAADSSGVRRVGPIQGKSNLLSSRKSVGDQVSAQPASFGVSPPSHLNSEASKNGTQGVSQMAKFVDLNNCTVSFIDDIRLPAKENGVIKSLEVKEGDFVQAGTVVGKIDDELYQRMLEQAEMRYKIAKEVATDSVPIKAAEAKYRVASIEASKTIKLAANGSKSDSDRMMAIYTKDIASLERETAQREKDKAHSEALLEAARFAEVQTRIRRHVLHSDFDAYVIEVFKKPQEYVQMGEEVMRIARMDKLWVQGIVNIKDLNPYEVIDRPVTVTVDLARGDTTTFDGKIVYVALERQSLKSYMVKAEITNRRVGDHWELQPLSSVKMRVQLDGETTENSIGSASEPSVKR